MPDLTQFGYFTGAPRIYSSFFLSVYWIGMIAYNSLSSYLQDYLQYYLYIIYIDQECFAQLLINY